MFKISIYQSKVVMHYCSEPSNQKFKQIIKQVFPKKLTKNNFNLHTAYYL